MPTMHLVRPAQEHLTSYVAALERGWSADSVRGAVAAKEERELIWADATTFLARLDARGEGSARQITGWVDGDPNSWVPPTQDIAVL